MFYHRYEVYYRDEDGFNIHFPVHKSKEEAEEARVLFDSHGDPGWMRSKAWVRRTNIFKLWWKGVEEDWEYSSHILDDHTGYPIRKATRYERVKIFLNARFYTHRVRRLICKVFGHRLIREDTIHGIHTVDYCERCYTDLDSL